MRLPHVIAWIFCCLVLPQVAAAHDNRLDIRVETGGWGNVDPRQIQVVLYSVADELASQLPARLAAPIVVTHSDGPPVSLYKRGPGGEYRVALHASGTYWHLYVYEFAHEYCHILSNYDEHVGANIVRYNQWFEESLCETASLYTLEHLASTWEHSPPTPEWSAHADKLRRFFELLVAEGHRKLPPQTTLAAWLRDNEDQLRHDPYQRQKNDLIAKMLLPLFERNPENWEALSYLNLDPPIPAPLWRLISIIGTTMPQTSRRPSLATFLNCLMPAKPHRCRWLPVRKLLSLPLQEWRATISCCRWFGRASARASLARARSY